MWCWIIVGFGVMGFDCRFGLICMRGLICVGGELWWGWIYVLFDLRAVGFLQC